MFWQKKFHETCATRMILWLEHKLLKTVEERMDKQSKLPELPAADVVGLRESVESTLVGQVWLSFEDYFQRFVGYAARIHVDCDVHEFEERWAQIVDLGQPVPATGPWIGQAVKDGFGRSIKKGYTIQMAIDSAYTKERTNGKH